MSDSLLTPGNIMFVIGIISLILGIYKSYSQPQQEIEKRQSLDVLATEKDKLIAEKDLGTKATILAQKELETKALVLAEQVKNKDVENERRFNEMGVRLDSSMALAQNHIHSVSVQLETLTALVNTMNLQMTKLNTTMEERLPRK